LMGIIDKADVLSCEVVGSNPTTRSISSCYRTTVLD
jgi:hypothetical protein